MNQAFVFQLGFKIGKTNVETQNIIGTILKTYKIVVSTFSILDKDGKERFFEKSFLLANITPNIVFEMFFLIMSNTGIDFQAQDLY